MLWLIRKNKTLILLAIFVFFIVGLNLIFNITSALAEDQMGDLKGVDKALGGLNTTADTGFGSGYAQTEGNKTLSVRIGQIVGAGLAFIGVIFFLLVIYGGLLWMIARGNEQEVTKAKDIITAAVIGLVIVLAAYAITVYIGGMLGQ